MASLGSSHIEEPFEGESPSEVLRFFGGVTVGLDRGARESQAEQRAAARSLTSVQRLQAQLFAASIVEYTKGRFGQLVVMNS